MPPRLPTLILALAVLVLSTGCESPPKTASLDDAVADYHAGRYALAHQRSVQAMRRASGTEREQAAYIAGLSAFQRDDLEEAELRLRSAVHSSDGRMAASAKAMLGQVRLARRQPQEAATLFEEAARGLDGHDAQQAAQYAAAAHHQTGNAAQAERWQTIGAAGGGDAQVAHAPRGGTGGFTIQVGAFHERPRAAQAAAEATSLARQHGLGPARIVPRPDSRGRTLYVVQFGSFATRTAAEQARTRIARQEFIVARQQ